MFLDGHQSIVFFPTHVPCSFPWDGWPQKTSTAYHTVGYIHDIPIYTVYVLLLLVKYPLVNVYITNWKITIFDGKTHCFYGHFQ